MLGNIYVPVGNDVVRDGEGKGVNLSESSGWEERRKLAPHG